MCEKFKIYLECCGPLNWDNSFEIELIGWILNRMWNFECECCADSEKFVYDIYVSIMKIYLCDVTYLACYISF